MKNDNGQQVNQYTAATPATGLSKSAAQHRAWVTHQLPMSGGFIARFTLPIDITTEELKELLLFVESRGK
jgi:hypothetical protein